MKLVVCSSSILILLVTLIACPAMGQNPAAGKQVPLVDIPIREGKNPTVAPNTTINTVNYSNAYKGIDGTEYVLNKKYDWFIADFAVDDDVPVGHETTLFIWLDGEEKLGLTVRAFESPKPVNLKLTGAMRMRIVTGPCADCAAALDEPRIIDPRLIVGEPSLPQFACSVCGKTLADAASRDRHVRESHDQEVQGNVCSSCGTKLASKADLEQHIKQVHSTFAVDAKDLDILASGLRKRVDSNPSIKQKVDTGFVALMTFNLVDISSQSVATNVAEDLSTAMINNQFGLVERGQLDKALKELKIQDSALIDPTTAKKIGQFTGCDIILVGSISDRGDRVVVNGRLLATATGKAFAAERVEMRKVPISR